jgi:membrane associated rhomboid family serine protease
VSIVDDIKYEFTTKSNYVKLIYINLAVFIIIRLFLLIGDFMLQGTFGSTFLSKLMLYSDLSKLLTQPWSILSYMFVHVSFWHIVFNLLVLYWFGRIFEDLVSATRLIPVFIMGGLVGGVVFLLTSNLFPVFNTVLGNSSLVGASAGIAAIILATATLAPNYTIHMILIGPVQIKWIAIVLIGMDVLFLSEGNTGGRLAHLGGAFAGYLYVFQLRKGNDFSDYMIYFWNKITSLFKKKEKKLKVVKKGSPSNVKPKKVVDQDHQDKLDAILDKISRSGYESLSTEEKAFLFDISKQK